MYAIYSLFIHLLMDTEVASISIVNNVAMIIVVYISFWISIFLSFKYIPTSGNAASYHDSIFSHLRHLQTVSKVVAPTYIPINSILLFSCSVMSNSLQRITVHQASCPSLFPRVCSDSHPLGQWCHPTFAFSIVFFSSCPQSFPVSGSFLISWLFTSGGQSIGVSVSASALPMNIQG